MDIVADEDRQRMSAPLHIGAHPVATRAFLALMPGVSDEPFRAVSHRLGAGLVVSEMVASEDLVRERHHVLRRLGSSGERPFVVQLAGREPHWMAEGARIA